MILLLSFNSFTKIVKGERRKNQARLNFLFRTASYLCGLPQRYVQTSEKHEVYFNVFHSECRVSSQFTAKIVKGERRKKSSSLEFFIPSRILSSPERQRYVQTSEKHEVYFDVFHSECSISSRFTAKIVKGERRKNQVHLNFLFRTASYLRRNGKDTYKRAKNMKFTSMFFTASAGYLRSLLQRY